MFWKLQAKILASIYGFAVNTIKVITITIKKKFIIYDLVKKIIHTTMFSTKRISILSIL